ncbi:MAG: DUF2889 domain-containing protein [Deltaproteobacteria bacterium]|nr:DUF2889 domain-containing protein [Deltaproteobacteria bacterium]
MLDAAGHPLHTRSLSVTLREATPERADFAAYVLDLRKRGFAPVGGDLQGTGIIHHMQLDGAIDRAARRIDAIAAQMPAVAFEASETSRGESCRDQSGRVAQLAGTALDGGYARSVGAEIGGPRGCSHILTLAQLLAPSARWGLDEDARLHGGAAPARRAGERIFRRDITADGYETTPGHLVLTLQLNDLHFTPAAPQPQPMDRFAAQREITARAAITMHDLVLHALTIHERARTLATLREADWQERSADAAPLLGGSLRAGITARIMQTLPDAPLRDALLQIAPALIQCFAALDIWQLFPDGGVAGATGGLPDSCYMWRTGGGLNATREKRDRCPVRKR